MNFQLIFLDLEPCWLVMKTTFVNLIVLLVKEMSVKTSLFLWKVIYVDHQNRCLFTNKGHLFNTFIGFNWCSAKFHD